MIIVFADDQTVSVFPDLGSVQGECEAIDVEEGAFHFFDELGRRLVPRFTSPVRRSRSIFGISSVGGGNFELDLDPEDQSSFETSLANAVAIEPNRWFATLEDLGRHIAENRKGNN
jgi:hypothetical protein